MPKLSQEKSQPFTVAVMTKGGGHIGELYSMVCKSLGGVSEYGREEFSSDVSRVDEENILTVIGMPPCTDPGDCRRIYIFTNTKIGYTSYFTVEKAEECDAPSKGELLCGREFGAHITFSEYGGDEDDALRLMYGYHTDRKAQFE